MIVRFDPERHMARVLTMIRALIDEAPNLQHAPFDFPSAAATLRMPGVTGFVVERDGKAVGFAFMFKARYPWSDREHAGDLGVYVSPHYRNGITAKKLVEAMIEQAGAWGVPLDLGVMTGIPAAMRFYLGLGFEPAGALFRKHP
jgi:GNAT superfamily N-acetyltransferase